MPEKELEDYVKAQRTLGVSDTAIKKSLINAGYGEEEFKQLFEKRTLKSSVFNVETKHTLYLNIATIVFIGMLFLYLTNDYNQKISKLTLEEKNGLQSLNDTIKSQTEALKAQMTSQASTINSAIDKNKAESVAALSDLSTSVQNYNYQSLNRDSVLSNSIQSSSNNSLTQLSSFQHKLQTVEDAAVDFTPIIPKAVSAVVTIGKKEQGYFVTMGSGVIIDSNGYLVTNYHVVDNLGQLYVKMHEGVDYAATMVGKDEKWDVAVLKITTEKKDFDELEWADSDKAFVGEHVIAIGNPIGLESTVTEGIISSTKRAVEGDSGIFYIQTDVAINAGNSGGPLIDKDGKIVGINTMKYSQIGYEGLSFALRSNDVRGVVLKILQAE